MATNKNIKINLDYSDFSGGISECQRKMGLLTEQFKMQESALDSNATEVDKLRLSQSSLSDRIGLQIQIVEKAQQKFIALSEAEGVSKTQVDNAQKSYMKQITTLNNLTHELEKVNNKLEQASEGEQDFEKSSEKAGQGSKKMSSNITSTISTVASFVTAIQQAVSALSDFATKATSFADDLQTTAQQMGVTTDTLQELSYAANFVDVSVETMQGSMAKLTQKMAEAQNGSTSASQAFDNIGVSVTNADGSLRSSEQVFYDVIDALGRIDNVAERDAASMEIFGRSAQSLNSLISSGSSTLQRYGQEAQDLGIVMSGDTIQILSNAQDSFDRLNAIMDAGANEVSAAFAPAFADIADRLSKLNPAILGTVKTLGNLIESANPVVQSIGQMAEVANTATIAKYLMAGATTTEAAAEVSLAGAASMANAAIAPEIILIAGLVLALAGLAYGIYKLVELFKEFVEIMNEASDSTERFSEASTGISTADPEKDGASGGRGHYALGGRVSGGRVWVGEQGAELVDLPAGSTVYNHQESQNMSSSNNVFNVTIDASSVDSFNKVVSVFNGLSQSMNRGGTVNG